MISDYHVNYVEMNKWILAKYSTSDICHIWQDLPFDPLDPCILNQAWKNEVSNACKPWPCWKYVAHRAHNTSLPLCQVSFNSLPAYDASLGY